MQGSRPDPDGSGLDRVQALEAARRRLYARGGAGAEQVAEFERLAGASTPSAAGEGSAPAVAETEPARDTELGAARSDEGGRAVPSVRATGIDSSRRTGGWLRRRSVQVVGAAAAVALLAVAIAVSRPASVTDVAVPALAGTTILGFGRSADPATDARSVTYQPQGYTVFQPRGRTVAVAVRCIGEGRVRISAGARFDFRCTDRERTVARRDAAPRDQPFVIMGRTVGDVVWSARVVLLDPPQTAGALPSFKDVCDSCLSTRDP